MLPCAYLRIFRPLDAFGEEERAGWERYILGGGAPPAVRPVYREEATAGERRLGLLASAEGEHADIRFSGGTYYVCPWRTRLRILASIVSLRESAVAEVAETFVPEAEARRAARELARLRRREPSAAPCMLQSPWHVPIRWFVLVDDGERRLVESVENDGGYRLYYWTPINLARKRAERALAILRRSELAPLVQMVRELAQWLSAFDSRAYIELDYGGVSSLFSWDDLDNDHSGREVQEAVEAIGQPGGMGRAGELYQGVMSRWSDAMSRESLN
jgi:hypothetical protein